MIIGIGLTDLESLKSPLLAFFDSDKRILMRFCRMAGYYSQKLSAERLKRCYEIAPPRKQRYLQAEIDYVAGQILSDETILDLGCGYGRTLKQFAPKAGLALGLDQSLASLEMGREFLKDIRNVHLIVGDAASLPLKDNSIDTLICIQNGLSAFHLDPRIVITEAIRATRPGGRLFFSSYSPKIWEARLEWFELQAKEGLVGEIDYTKTGNGQIVGKDGFTATTITEELFNELTKQLDAEVSIFEVDESSLFCSIKLSSTETNSPVARCGG